MNANNNNINRGLSCQTHAQKYFVHIPVTEKQAFGLTNRLHYSYNNITVIIKNAF